MCSASVRPKQHEVYTLRDIVQKLSLRDSPHLGFQFRSPDPQETESVLAVIQNSHVTDEDLLSIPGFADSKWKYLRETEEWIPVFSYADELPITDFVEMELDLHPYNLTHQWWVTPKGFPRDQYVLLQDQIKNGELEL